MSGLLVQPFPVPGPSLRQAYRELNTAINGTDDQIKALGPLSSLARPWIPSTITDQIMRVELWAWLEQAVAWLNHEMVWAPDQFIVPCWPQHPHLVQELLILVDRRYRAETALDTNAHEDWHRYSWPSFLERNRQRLQTSCVSAHEPSPSTPRFERSLREFARARQAAFHADVSEFDTDDTTTTPAPGLRLVNETTGELFDGR